jgi:hypothetical protein
MTLDEAREHVGETVVHGFLDKPPEEAVIIKAGDHAVYVRFAGSSEVVTMHPRWFSLRDEPGADPLVRSS